MKTNAFETYLASIFLYNSELWTINQKILTRIDSFQRRMLRIYVLNIRYPRIIRNEEVYRITKQKQWSIQIKIRRLKWL